MKAMILAAGLGTRLAPLTYSKPKALIDINGKPLLQIIIEKLKNSGFYEIIINLHHFSEQVLKFLEVNNNFGIEIHISDESELLLDTGGAIKKAASFFGDGKPFLLHNVDIISDINLNNLCEFHFKNSPLVTITVSKRKTSRYLLFNKKKNLCGWENINTGDKIISGLTKYSDLERFAFNGIHIINPCVFDYFPKENIFSIIQFYLNICNERIIKGYCSSANFFDIGSIEKLEEYKYLFNI